MASGRLTSQCPFYFAHRKNSQKESRRKMGNLITIKAMKFPDIPHYEWQGEVIEQTEEYVLVLCLPGRQLKHFSKNKTFTLNDVSLEYFSLNEWFTAAMEIEQGKIVSYYCNIAMPSRIIGNVLSFVDLDLDYVKTRGAQWQVVDEEEFETNSIRYRYPAELKRSAAEALEDLKGKVENKLFPFGEMERILDDFQELLNEKWVSER